MKTQTIFPNKTHAKLLTNVLIDKGYCFGFMSLDNGYFEVMIWRELDKEILEYVKNKATTYKTYENYEAA